MIEQEEVVPALEACARCGHTIPTCAQCGKDQKVLGGYIGNQGRYCHTFAQKPTCYEQATRELFGCDVDSPWRSKK